MTQRMNVGSTKWTGVLLIFFITRLSQCQITTMSLNREIMMNSSGTKEPMDLLSGNSTILRKSDQGIVHLTALNDDRERQMPFYLTTTSTIESTTTYDSLSKININQRQLNYEEKQLPINHEQEKIIKLQKINSTKTEKIENKIKDNNDNLGKKNLFEKLIIHPHSLIDNDKRPFSELNIKDDAEDLEDKISNQEPMTPRTTQIISLINDTIINDIKNKTNIIQKPKDPKDDIEIIHNPIVPKTLRIIKNITDNDEIIEVNEKLDDLKKDDNKNNNMNNNLTEKIKNDDKNNNNNNNLTPKARTISFGTINSFSSTEEKAIGLTKEHSEVDITKEVRQQPYPYIKTNSNTSFMNKTIVKESDEIFALENTIGKNNDDKKLIITESSLIIDNSIQQLKPLNQKRSSNLSKIITDNNNTNESIIIPKLSDINLNLTYEFKNKIKDNYNDIPRNDDLRKSTLDLIENRLIDNSDKNSSIFDYLKTTKINSIESTTEINNNNNNNNLNKTLIETMIKESKSNLTSNITDDLMKQKNLSNFSNENTTPKTLFNVSTTALPTVGEIPPNKPTLSTAGNNTQSIPTLFTAGNTTQQSPTLPTLSNNTQQIPVLSISDNNTLQNPTLSAVDNSDLQIPTLSTVGNLTLLKENLLDSKNWTLNQNGRNFEPETTISSVEYEFVGLTESTQSLDNINNITNNVDKNASDIILTTLPTVIINTTTLRNFDEPTTVKTTLDIDTTTEINNSYESISTTENSFIDTTIVTTILNEDFDHTMMIINETTTISSVNITEESAFIVNSTEKNMVNLSSTLSINDLSTEISSTTPLTTLESETMKSSTEMMENVQETSTDVLNSLNTTENNEDNEQETSLGEDSTSSETSPSYDKEITEVITTPSSTIVEEFTPEDVPLLVGVVVEGGWADVCPHLGELRESLADLLTSVMEKIVSPAQIVFQKNPCMEKSLMNSRSMEMKISTILLYVVDENGSFDPIMTKSLPGLYSKIPFESHLTIRSLQLVQDADSGNAIAVVVISCVAFICLALLASLLFIMRKRQTRFNYGERCRPVSLDAYSLDSVSAYNSVRRKGAARASKRSYGNPTFEDSSAIPSHPLNFAGLSSFCNEQNAIHEEFTNIPSVTARIDELPSGAEVKNRYANVVPLPETRVPLLKINNDPLSEYINASYVRGPKNATKYYIACQAPIESTVTDFWRMIWEQQSKVIIMLTDLIENGVEKCAEYIPPSEVTDCHRLFGDYQVTLKKRETKEKYAISTLHLKNLENNTYREISHIWYLWPANGVQTDTAGLIAVILEARALQRGGPGPIVVHCSPGTGRTGTLIALDLGIRQYEITRTVDVPRVVYTIRRDRAGAVQTKEQYAFIYQALNLYATKLAGGGLEST